jgi:Delta7-sterol 5-desaturase
MEHWTLEVILCALIIGVINFPFVLGVERYLRAHRVKYVYSLAASREQRMREQRNAFITTPIHALLFLSVIATGALRVGSNSPAGVIGTFLLAFVWTEIWHYFSHRAMHWRPLHFVHVEHHRSLVTNSWTSVSFSLAEKLVFSAGILGLLGVISQLHALSASGVTAYYVLYFFTNTLGHSNFEFREPGYRETVMGKIFNSPSYHAMHHARYVNNYSLLTPFLDKAFHTEWADASAVQTRVAMGKPLASLRERASSPLRGS